MQRPIFHAVTGPACLFKTSSLRLLQSRGLPVVYGDYHEDCVQYPEFKDKAVVPLLELEYPSHVLSRFQCDHVHDRPTTDSLWYWFVFQHMHGKLSDTETRAGVRQVCERTVSKLNKLFNVIVFLPADKGQLLERMKLRRQDVNNTLGKKYIDSQVLVFTEVALACNWPTFVIASFEDANKAIVDSFVPALSHVLTPIAYKYVGSYSHDYDLSTSKFILRKATPAAAGWDLPVDEDVKLEPGQSVWVRTGFKIKLPPNHHAQILPRSSCFAKSIVVFCGLIDEDYIGEICVGVTNASLLRIVLKRGQYVGQLVICSSGGQQLPKSTHIFIPKCSLGVTVRGEHGFGSTD